MAKDEDDPKSSDFLYKTAQMCELTHTHVPLKRERSTAFQNWGSVILSHLFSISSIAEISLTCTMALIHLVGRAA